MNVKIKIIKNNSVNKINRDLNNDFQKKIVIKNTTILIILQSSTIRIFFGVMI